MTERRFEVRFDEDAYREYLKLDHSVVRLVDNILERLEMRADEIGKPLKNKYLTKLYGLKEVKLRQAGIRIIFRVTDEMADGFPIVYVLAIEKREDNLVFHVAEERYRKFKSQITMKNLSTVSLRWERKRRIKKSKPRRDS
ncbi:MAG: hypothetical protein IRY98_11795 [Alicyclobacillaceae bacterium]|nr:hypothetical protein [Alicyclobacillaceae bacterium]